MKKSIMIKIPSQREYFSIVRSALKDIGSKVGFDEEEKKEIIEAVRELVENSIVHAYKMHEGIIEIDITSFDNGMRVDVRDWGEPISHLKPRAVPINLKEDKGFNRIYKLTDQFEYFNLGKDGKKFSIIKFLSHPHKKEEYQEHISQKDTEEEIKESDIVIREYKKGDEESISRLIYRNYGYTYLKSLFYYPKKIAEHEGSKFYSIVAEINSKIVGHFALVRSYDSNIAEVGVVVVDPRYKGRGIMNKMFKALIDWAKRLGFYAIYGEAIMFHIYSQKSNLTYGFCESALVIGRVNEDTKLTNNKLSSKAQRGSVLIGYKIFKPITKKIVIPKIYEEKIAYIYQKCNNISYEQISSSKERDEFSKFAYFNDPLSNTAVLVIDKVGDKFEKKFSHLLDHARAKHSDMIYADINMENIRCIDEIVDFLNHKKFYFSGVLFLKHKNQDYLRLQYKHSDHVGKKNIICYSSFCKELLEFIREDEKRVRYKI